jgi:hypothetical protein
VGVVDVVDLDGIDYLGLGVALWGARTILKFGIYTWHHCRLRALSSRVDGVDIFFFFLFKIAQGRGCMRSRSGSWGYSPLRESLVSDVYMRVACVRACVSIGFFGSYSSSQLSCIILALGCRRTCIYEIVRRSQVGLSVASRLCNPYNRPHSAEN